MNTDKMQLLYEKLNEQIKSYLQNDVSGEKKNRLVELITSNFTLDEIRLLEKYRKTYNEKPDVLSEIQQIQAKIDQQSFNYKPGEVKALVIKNFENIEARLKMFIMQQNEPIIENANKTTLKAAYPDFVRHLPVLITAGFLIETATGYSWQKSKSSLAFYFKNLTPTGKRDWNIIERAFNQFGLRNSSKNAYDKPPRDYEELARLLS